MITSADLDGLPSVGVASLDDDHRIILGIIIDLQEAVEEDDDPEILGSMVIFLCDHILTHLRREERLMDKLGYPDFPSHKTAHAELVAWNSTFRASYMENSAGWLTADKLTAPAEWWVNHILTVDMLYKDFFAARTEEVANALSTEDLFEIYGFDSASVEKDDPFFPLHH